MAKDKVRFGIIDLYRFIGCLLIMGHHCYHIQDKTGGVLCRRGMDICRMVLYNNGLFYM